MRRLAAGLVLAGAIAVGSTDAAFSAASASPGNVLATGRSTWFAGNASGTVLCTGTNATLACPFGVQAAVGKVQATIALQNKDVATTYTLSVVDGTGPAPLSTLVTVAFASAGGTNAALAAVAADTVNVVVRIKGGTPAGSYTGTLVIADTTTGASVAVPISVTH